METRRFIDGIIVASHALDERKEEINKLNVFPVPDGDTGTNMSLTLKSVEENILQLPQNATKEAICKAITNGALMGARGNSGVITSQILRGICEGIKQVDGFTTKNLSFVFSCATEVAYSAVRKPVKGTILTVLSDINDAAARSAKSNCEIEEALSNIASAAFESVKSTPEYLPILKENGVVDAGGYGLAIFIDAFICYYLGKESALGLSFDVSQLTAPKVEIEQINDWEGSKYRYCNEFLVDSDTLVIEDALNFLSTMGDCELCVGATPKFKVHVHSNEPNKVLEYFLNLGQISEVHIHNMQLQSQDRAEKLKKESDPIPCAIIAVAAGEGNADIFKSLDVDVVVSGGQTMNPSTKDLLDAANSILADSYIFLPNNSNIVMAAQSACNLLDKPAICVPTKSILEGFSALFVIDKTQGAQDNEQNMIEAITDVVTGEVTTAIKDSKDVEGNPIHNGDVIGILNGDIVSVGHDISDVTIDLIKRSDCDDFDTCTLLAGQDFSQEELDCLARRIEEQFDNLEIDSHIGGQPLYPILFSLE